MISPWEDHSRDISSLSDSASSLSSHSALQGNDRAPDTRVRRDNRDGQIDLRATYLVLA